MTDLPVQSFVGNSSTRNNLSLILHEEFHNLAALYEEDKAALFDGLEEATSPVWREAVWSMVWGRWCSLESLRTA